MGIKFPSRVASVDFQTQGGYVSLSHSSANFQIPTGALRAADERQSRSPFYPVALVCKTYMGLDVSVQSEGRKVESGPVSCQ